MRYKQLLILTVIFFIGISFSSISSVNIFNLQIPELLAKTSNDLMKTSSTVLQIEEITPAAVRDLRLEVESSDLSEMVKNSIFSDCDKAVDALQRAKSQTENSQNFVMQIKNAPMVYQALQKRLEQRPVRETLHVPENASLDVLSQYLHQAESSFNLMVENYRKAVAEPAKRIEERQVISRQIMKKKENIKNLTTHIQILSMQKNDSLAGRVKLMTLQANLQADEAELNSLEQRLNYFNASIGILALQKTERQRIMKAAEAKVGSWHKILNKKRESLAIDAYHSALQQTKYLKSIDAPEAFIELSQKNAELANQRAGSDGLIIKLAEVNRAIEKNTLVNARLDASFKSLLTKEKAIGLTPAIGQLFRKILLELPDTRPYKARINQRHSELSNIQFEMIMLSENLTNAEDSELSYEELISHIPEHILNDKRQLLENTANTLLNTQLRLLKELSDDFNTYFNRMIQRDSIARQLISNIEHQSSYINERILWVRSCTFLSKNDIDPGFSALKYLFSKDIWINVPTSIIQDARHNLWIYASFTLLFFVMLFIIGKLNRNNRIKLALSQNKQGFIKSIQAILLLIINALIWPSLIWFIGFRLSQPKMVPVFLAALGAGFLQVAYILFAFKVIKSVCSCKGIGMNDFKWNVNTTKAFHYHLSWFQWPFITLLFFDTVFKAQPNILWTTSLGRIIFLISIAFIFSFIFALFRPDGAFVSSLLKDKMTTLLWKLRYIWFVILLFIPIALFALAFIGYLETSEHLETSLFHTSFLIISVIMLHSICLKWVHQQHLFMARRVQEKKQKIKSGMKLENGTTKGSGVSSEILEANQAKLQIESLNQEKSNKKLSAQTLQLINYFTAFLFIVGMWCIWKEILPAFRYLNNIELWTTLEKTTKSITGIDGKTISKVVTVEVPITLGNIFLAILSIVVTTATVKNLAGVMETVILSKSKMEQGSKQAFVTLLQYVLIAVGIAVTFGCLGLQWSKIQWLIAAMSVGIGFGLQDIIANFISGIILLLERPIRVGDVVTIGKQSGSVIQVSIRATKLLDWDRKEVIVPNKSIITSQFTNWTLKEKSLRILIPIGVTYGANTQLVQDLLLKIAQENKRIADTPAPMAVFRSFGDSTLNFELRCYVADYLKTGTLGVTHDLCMSIDQEFKKANINMAFPQQEIWINNGDRPFDVNSVGSSGS